MIVGKSLKLPDATCVDVMQKNHVGEICYCRSISAQRISFPLSQVMNLPSLETLSPPSFWELSSGRQNCFHLAWDTRAGAGIIHVQIYAFLSIGARLLDFAALVAHTLWWAAWLPENPQELQQAWATTCTGEHPEQSEVVAVTAELLVSGANGSDQWRWNN